MKFEELIISLKNGKKIARKAWNNHKVYDISLNKKYINEPIENILNYLDLSIVEDNNDPNVMPWRMAQSDINSDDWYVVDTQPLTGWECPRCNSINSPYERMCVHCTEKHHMVTFTIDTEERCTDHKTNHKWGLVDVITTDKSTIHKYQCLKCGLEKVTDDPIFEICNHLWIPDTGTAANSYKCMLCGKIKDDHLHNIFSNE